MTPDPPAAGTDAAVAHRAAQDLSAVLNKLYTQILALSDFGAEAMAGPLHATFNEIDPVARMVGDMLRQAGTEAQTLREQAKGLREEKALTDEMNESLISRWQEAAGRSAAGRTASAMVRALREQLDEEVRAGRLKARSTERIFKAADQRSRGDVGA